MDFKKTSMMKESSKEFLTAAIGIAAGTALGIILTKTKHEQVENKSGNLSTRNRNKEKLIFVKNKLEKHKDRLDRHLQRINSKIESYHLKEGADPV
jgi:hypothetical protein